MALPILPVQGQDPWFDERSGWDAAVQSELDGRLSKSSLDSQISREVVSVPVERFRTSTNTDTEVVRQAIRFAASYSSTYEHPTVVFAAREYLITDSGIFSDLGVSSQVGMRFQGQGRTRLKLVTSGSEKWFFDNGSTSRLSYASWADIEFTTDDTSRTYGNGFKFTSSGHEKNYTFERCHWTYMNEVFYCAGNVNADTIRLAPGCRMLEINTALRLENPQAVIMEWFGPTIHLCRKSMFVIGPGGGGDIKVYGGDLIMENVAGDTAPYALLDVSPGANIGIGNARNTFHGIKTELRSQNTMLVNAPGSAGAVIASFVDCNLATTGSSITPHPAVTIGNRRMVSFTRCTLSPNHQYVLNVAVGAAPGENETLIAFEFCDVPENLSSLVSWTQSSRYGRVSNRNSRLLSSNPSSKQAVDFDLNWVNAGNGSTSTPAKRYSIFASTNRAWPSGGSSERVITLPLGAVITRIVVNRPAIGSSATGYSLKVGNDDKSTVYATSTSASGQFKDRHTIDVQPLVDVGTSSLNRTVRLWGDPVGDGTAVFGGWAWVEYI